MIRLLSLLIMIAVLAHDFKKTKGHIKAKVIHSVILTFLIYYYSASFAYLGSLVNRSNEIINNYYVALGFMTPEFNIIVWGSQVIISCLMLYSAWGLLYRKEKGRKFLLKIIPFGIIVETFGFYRGFISGGDFGLNHYLILVLGLVIVGLSNGVIFMIYKSNFMSNFFNPEENLIIEDHLIENKDDN